jgi:hypothetical protein
MPAKELSTPLLIVGASAGGTAAALAAARNGTPCILTEPTDWVGGQLTTQAVPPDENQWIEGKDGVQGATRSYLAYREGVRQYYRDHRPLAPAARDNPRLNPGNGWVSHLCHEPAVGHAVLQRMLTPHIATGLIRVLLHHEPIAADTAGDAVRSVTLRDTRTGETVTVTADYILDATELGDLLPLAGIEYAVGAEHQSEHNEPHARPDRADPADIQAISWCFALEHRPGEDHTIDRPANYDFWRTFTPPLQPHPWPGPLFSWTQVGGDEHKPRHFRWVPWPDEPKEGELEMWRYRRITDAGIYTPSSLSPQSSALSPEYPDVALVNMVQMDYFLKPTLDVGREAQEAAFAQAREQSLCFLYWMQTEAPRHDSPDRLGYPGLKLRGDELGTSDGFAKYPYIRESRRLRALTTVAEPHVNPTLCPKSDVPQGLSEPWPDSVGIGHYRLDLHPSAAMRSSIYVPTAPFRIPLGALIPRRVTNVLAACKNLGVTHVTNGCYRLHPTEWNVGESAALLASFCLANNVTPHQVHASRDLLRRYQSLLTTHGIPLAWPWDPSNLS